MSARDRQGEGDVVLAAGAVLWRERDGDQQGSLPETLDGRVEVAVVHRPKYDDWSLPKGKLDTGEHLLETAVREVQEETGFTVQIGRSLGATSYIALGRPKRVHYWAAEAISGDFVPTDEVDVLEWVSVEQACERVDRDADRAVLREFTRQPVRTHVVVVLRHAKAISRKAWEGEDELRPLSREGQLQAGRVATLLPIWRPGRVLSSPWTRCVQTVTPLLGGQHPDTDEALSEAGHEKQPDAAMAIMRDLVQDPKGRDAVVVCSHRPVLPDLVGVLREVSVGGRLDLGLDANPLKPAELLVAHIAQGKVVAAERHRP